MWGGTMKCSIDLTPLENLLIRDLKNMLEPLVTGPVFKYSSMWIPEDTLLVDGMTYHIPVNRLPTDPLPSPLRVKLDYPAKKDRRSVHLNYGGFGINSLMFGIN